MKISTSDHEGSTVPLSLIVSFDVDAATGKRAHYLVPLADDLNDFEASPEGDDVPLTSSSYGDGHPCGSEPACPPISGGTLGCADQARCHAAQCGWAGCITHFYNCPSCNQYEEDQNGYPANFACTAAYAYDLALCLVDLW